MKAAMAILLCLIVGSCNRNTVVNQATDEQDLTNLGNLITDRPIDSIAMGESGIAVIYFDTTHMNQYYSLQYHLLAYDVNTIDSSNVVYTLQPTQQGKWISSAMLLDSTPIFASEVNGKNTQFRTNVLMSPDTILQLLTYIDTTQFILSALETTSFTIAIEGISYINWFQILDTMQVDVEVPRDAHSQDFFHIHLLNGVFSLLQRALVAM